MSRTNLKLEQLFGSKTRARLLGLFINNPEKTFFVRELTRKIDAQLNSVRRELQNLVLMGFVNEIKAGHADWQSDLSSNKKYYKTNSDFLLYEDLHALLKKAHILLKKNLVQQIEGQGKIDYLAYTGKFVGEANIPTDVLIVGSIDQKVLQKMVKAFEKELGEEINYTLMPREEYLYRFQITDRFLFSILENKKVVVVDKFSKGENEESV